MIFKNGWFIRLFTIFNVCLCSTNVRSLRGSKRDEQQQQDAFQPASHCWAQTFQRRMFRVENFEGIAPWRDAVITSVKLEQASLEKSRPGLIVSRFALSKMVPRYHHCRQPLVQDINWDLALQIAKFRSTDVWIQAAYTHMHECFVLKGLHGIPCDSLKLQAAPARQSPEWDSALSVVPWQWGRAWLGGTEGILSARLVGP